MGIISMDKVWDAYEKVTDTLGGIRTHVNTGFAKATSAIEKEACKLIDATHGNSPVPIKELEKKDVVLLMDKVVTGAAVAKWVAIGLAVATFYAVSQTATLSPLLKLTMAISLFAAHEFYQIQNVVSDTKRGIDNGMLTDKVLWWKGDERARSIAPSINSISALLSTKLLFFNRSSLFGQEIRSITDYIQRRLDAAEKKEATAPHSDVKWVPDRTVNLVTVGKYEEGLKEGVKGLLAPMTDRTDSLNSYEVANYALEALRPIAFARATAISSALALYLASAYLPLGWVTFGLSLGAGFIATELHQAHESVLTEVYQPLVRPYATTLDEIEQLVKNACSKVRDTTWLLHKDFLFGKEIKQLPTFFHQLFDQKGDFDHADVKWVEKSSLTAMVKTLKNWKVYKPAWLATKP